MRIIDKNTDFYDFWQNIYRDNKFVFDRTDSYILTKEMLCQYGFRHSNDKYSFLLLQAGNYFWLFLVEFKGKDEMGYITNYNVELLHKWKNYHKQGSLHKLEVISFPYIIELRLRKIDATSMDHSFDKLKIIKNITILQESIDRDEHKVYHSFNRHQVYIGEAWKQKTIVKHIPLLIASGLAECIDSLELYNALEEYFSTQKTSSERVESKGLTDKEKISNHGFDVRTSFRNVGGKTNA